MNEALLNLPFDHFQRYGMAATIIRQLPGIAHGGKILEVGANEQRLLERFLPKAWIVYSDVRTSGSFGSRFIRASGSQLPFADKSFDAAVCLDVLEHVPDGQRDDFIAEVARVTSRLLVLACPTNDAWVSRAEAECSKLWRDLGGDPHQWLTEHQEHGLVDSKRTLQSLRRCMPAVAYFRHGEIGLWQAMMSAHFVKEFSGRLREFVASADRHYNEHVCGADSGSRCYRTFFVAGRQTGDRDALRKLPIGRAADGGHETFRRMVERAVAAVLDQPKPTAPESQKPDDRPARQTPAAVDRACLAALGFTLGLPQQDIVTIYCGDDGQKFTELQSQSSAVVQGEAPATVTFWLSEKPRFLRVDPASSAGVFSLLAFSLNGAEIPADRLQVVHATETLLEPRGDAIVTFAAAHDDPSIVFDVGELFTKYTTDARNCVRLVVRRESNLATVRQLGGLANTVARQHEINSSLLEALKEGLDGVVSSAAKIADARDQAIRSGLEKLTQQLDGLAKSIAQQRELDTSLLGSLKERLDGVISSAAKIADARDQAIRSRLDALAGQLTEAVASQALAEADRQRTIERFESSVRAVSAEHSERLGRLSETQTALGGSLRELNRGIAELTEEFRIRAIDADTRLLGIRHLIDAISQGSTASAQRLEEQLDALAQRNSMETRRIDEQLQRLESAINELAGRGMLRRVLRSLVELRSSRIVSARLDYLRRRTLRPIQSLSVRPDGDSIWISEGTDPQMLLYADPERALSAGWYMLTVPASGTDVALPSDATLYLDFGAGFSEANRISVTSTAKRTMRQIVCFSRDVCSLRLDPSELPGVRFAFSVMRLRKLTRIELAGRIMWRALVSVIRYPRSASRIIMGLASAARRGDVAAAGRVLDAVARRRTDRPEAHPVSPDDYAAWLRVTESQQAASMPKHRSDRSTPLFSVLLPVFNTPPEWLRQCIDSVRQQRFPLWELCIVDDASTAKPTLALLDQVCATDPRIRVLRRSSNGHIAVASQSALEMACGEFVALLDHDDRLHPDALLEFANAIERNPSVLVIYSDEDKIDESGQRFAPFFKPDWDPDLLLAQNYVCHLLALRAEHLRSRGGFRLGTEGSQDYDVLLRCTEGLTEREIEHIPRVLYHWRAHAGSTAATAESKPYAHQAGLAALRDHVARAGMKAIVEEGSWTFTYDVRYPLPTPAPRVSIVIPTRDRVDLLRPCLDSLFGRTRYPDWEVLIVDNGSVDPETARFLSDSKARYGVRAIRADIPFNWSRLCNIGETCATGSVLVFLNNDTVVDTPDWLLRLVENAIRPEIGVAGPLLLYGDGSIQHAGVVVGMGGWADHVFKGDRAEHAQRLFVSPLLRRRVLAVTGACMVIERTKFMSLGGFDESFQICGSDVALCLKARAHGLATIYVPEARLFHHESKSRDPRAIPEIDFRRSAEIYEPFRSNGDPYFNRNLDLFSCKPRLAPPESLLSSKAAA